MAVAGCINAYDCAGCYLTTLQQLQSDNIGVAINYTAPSEYWRRQLDYIKYTDKCGCTCCLTGENELRIVATQWVIKNFTLTNDDTNEVVNVKWNDLFGSNRAYTMVRYKTGSYPTSITDWTLAVKETTQNQYSVSWYNVSGLTDWTTYYFTAFAVSQDGTIIVVQNSSITTDFWYVVNANTLFFIKNDWEISDHSSYNHTMQWYWTSNFYTLSNWRKVIDFSWSSIAYSNTFNESINKTTFTLHCRVKMKSWTTEDNLVWRCGRNKNWTETSDRRWLRIQRDSWYSTYYILAWPNSTNRVSLWPSWINPWTSEFVLMSATVNWWVYKLYKNWVLYNTRSSSTIRWWSSTWTRFYMWWAVYSDWTKRSSTLSYAYMWETVLEDKTETDAEVLNFYNKTKKHYWY